MEQTRDERVVIATTILQQLGGTRFKTMTGAKNFLALGCDGFPTVGLRFKLPGGAGRVKNGINLVTVTLLPSDTYHMLFERVHGRKVTEISEHDGVYDDMLQSIFTAETGLDTHL